MTSPRAIRGGVGERLAAEHLIRLGYTIIEKNYRCRLGEIDIVARDGAVLCFVEVRSLRSDAHGDPLETVDKRKQARLVRAARHYMMTHHLASEEMRFDVVGLVYEPELRLQLVRDAFQTTASW